jgi:hypothetical protein
MRDRVHGVLDRRGWRLTLWYLLAAASVAITFLAGPYIQFPIAFVVPVVLAAWFDGLAHAATFAVALPVSRFAFVLGVWTVPWSEGYSLANAIIRIVVLGFVAVLVSRLAKQHRALRREVAMLERILPICSYCRRIRGQDEAWHQLEPYLRTHADLTFSHGYCPDCVRQHFPEHSGPG